MAKALTETRQITNFIRDAFRNKELRMDDIDTVHKTIDKFKEEYETSPETLLFLVQKINALALFNIFRAADGSQVYPKIQVLEPKDILAKHGIADINEEVQRRFRERRAYYNKENFGKSAGYSTTDLREFRKAAAANPEINTELDQRSDVTHKEAFDKAAAMNKIAELTTEYWKLSGIEDFIRVSKMEKSAQVREVLDEIRGRKLDSVITKNATLSDFISFANKVKEITWK